LWGTSLEEIVKKRLHLYSPQMHLSRTGIFVNIGFNKYLTFLLFILLYFLTFVSVYTPELGVFRLLVIPLYHGWMVDPQDSDTAKSFESKPYTALLEEVANYYARNAGGEEKKVLPEGKRRLRRRRSSLKYIGVVACGTTLILGPSTTPSVNLSMNGREPILDGLLINNLLKNNKNQLTIYGLCALQQGLEDGEFCVFFCNNHFNTMLKYNNELYVLITDQGYLSQPDFGVAVWEKLNEVSGNTIHVTRDFSIFRQTASTGINKYLASSGSSYENKLQCRPASQPASRLTTGSQ
ncbi:hypothetical protein MKX03_034556, partial [Papaver bracteatum]